MKPTLVTWILLVFGVITLAPLVLAQIIMLLKPNSQQARDIIIAKGADWRDKTHFRSALGCAWGYVLWGAAGAISLYINIVLWFMEKEYVYPSRGALAYYSYYWGFFVYWGALALAYSAIRLSGLEI